MAHSPPASPFLCTSSHRHITGSCYSHPILLNRQSLLTFVFFTLCQGMLGFFVTLKNPYFSPTASSLFHYQRPICDRISRLSYPDLSPSLALTLLTNHFLEINSPLGFHVFILSIFLHLWSQHVCHSFSYPLMFYVNTDVPHGSRTTCPLDSALPGSCLQPPSLYRWHWHLCLTLSSLVSVSRLSPWTCCHQHFKLHCKLPSPSQILAFYT